jgi:hypothetical protein
MPFEAEAHSMRTVASRLYPILATLALLLVTISLARAEETFNGRASGALVRPLLGSSMTPFVDTGELPSGGGRLEVSAPELQLGDLIRSSSELHAFTMSEGGSAYSYSSQEGVHACARSTIAITASHLSAEASASCDGVSGNSIIVDLMVAGRRIDVTGAASQKVLLDGGHELVLNEQIVDVRARSITVNALRLRFFTGSELILSSARAGVSCIVATERTDWQAVKALYR